MAGARPDYPEWQAKGMKRDPNSSKEAQPQSLLDDIISRHRAATLEQQNQEQTSHTHDVTSKSKLE